MLNMCPLKWFYCFTCYSNICLQNLNKCTLALNFLYIWLSIFLLCVCSTSKLHIFHCFYNVVLTFLYFVFLFIFNSVLNWIILDQVSTVVHTLMRLPTLQEVRFYYIYTVVFVKSTSRYPIIIICITHMLTTDVFIITASSTYFHLLGHCCKLSFL